MPRREIQPGSPRRRTGRPVRRSRRGCPAVETLESRWLLSLSVQFADPVGAIGAGAVNVESNPVVNDASGNVFVTGSLVGTADFDPSTSVANLTSAGGRDIFVARYAKSGALVWAKDLPGSSAASVGQGEAITLDASGNILVSGTFTGTVNFDPNGADAAATFAAGLRNDPFVAKYDPNGNLLWARDIVGVAGSPAAGYALTVDGSGNIVVAGTYSSSATFGSISVTGGGSTNGFVAKLNASGQFLWASATSGTTPTSGSASNVAWAGVSADGFGNVYTTGFLAGTAGFGTGAGTLNLSSNGGSRDILVQKLDSTGKLVWAETIGGIDIDQGNSIVADSLGNLYITGSYAQTVNFNPAGTANLTAGIFEDPFLLKLDPSGHFVWVRGQAMTQGGYGQGNGVALDGAGHVYASGEFSGTMTLDPSTTGASLTSAGSSDAYLAVFDTAGNYDASQSYGGANFDAAFGIGVNTLGQVALAGRYTGPAAFGSTTLPAQAGVSIFIAEVGNSLTTAPLAPAAPTLEAGSDSGLSNSDRITNLQSLTFDITGASSGNYVQLLRDGVVVASRKGSGAVTDLGPIANGNHTYTVIQSNTFSQVSPPSNPTVVTEDTTIPATPNPLSILPADDSGTKGDGITNVKQPHLVGKIDPLTLAQFLDPSGNVFASGMSASDGSFSITPPTALADGKYGLRVREEDVAGNFSVASTTLTLVIDTTPPATPATPTLLPADDSGTKGDGITNVKQPHLTGTTEANATVQLLSATGAVIGSTTASATGSYSVSPATALTDAIYPLRVQVLDAAANTSAASPALTLTIDTTPPATPATPTLLPADDSGVKGDGITNVKQPHLVGTSEPGATLQILDASGSVVGVTVVLTDGSYSAQISSPLADGSYAFRARATDAAGNVSPASSALNLVISTLAVLPATPSVPALLAADDTGVKGDDLTSVRQPRLTGTDTVGLTVQILDASGDVLGSGTVAASGTYTIEIAAPLVDGAYSLQARATDSSGNSSATSGAMTLTIDATPPAPIAAPTILPADDSGTVGDGITSVRQPRLVDSTEPGAVVQMLDGSGNVLATTTASATGAIQFAPSTALADSTYSMSLRATDAAGNVSAPGGVLVLTIDTTPPAAAGVAFLLTADDSGTLYDGITNVTMPHLFGKAAPGTTAQLVDATGRMLGSSLVGSNGIYMIQPTAPLASGYYQLRVRLVDAAGNVGPLSPVSNLIIMATPPPTPAAPVLLAADDTGIVGDGRTTVRDPRLTGTVPAGTQVALLNASGVVLATASAPSGTYTIQPVNALAIGTIALRVQVTDAAGNVSPIGPSFSLTVMESVQSDFDGNGKSDLAVYRPASGQWIVQNASGTGTVTTTYGWPGLYDIPVPGDYDGIGHSEVAVYRPATGQWFVDGPTGGRLLGTFGSPGDIPVPGDYDGVGHTEMAVYRPSTGQWFVDGATGIRLVGTYGWPGLYDIPVPGDYDGVGHTEMAVYRPATGQWFVDSPSGGRLLGVFGQTNLTDFPVEGPTGSLKALGNAGSITISLKSAGVTASTATQPTVKTASTTPTDTPAPVQVRAAQPDIVAAAIRRIVAQGDDAPVRRRQIGG